MTNATGYIMYQRRRPLIFLTFKYPHAIGPAHREEDSALFNHIRTWGAHEVSTFAGVIQGTANAVDRRRGCHSRNVYSAEFLARAGKSGPPDRHCYGPTRRRD